VVRPPAVHIARSIASYLAGTYFQEKLKTSKENSIPFTHINPYGKETGIIFTRSTGK
jgi:hypothetical protein